MWAIDNHTHIIYGAEYDERYVGFMPLIMREDIGRYLEQTEELFGTREPA